MSEDTAVKEPSPEVEQWVSHWISKAPVLEEDVIEHLLDVMGLA